MAGKSWHLEIIEVVGVVAGAAGMGACFVFLLMDAWRGVQGQGVSLSSISIAGAIMALAVIPGLIIAGMARRRRMRRDGVPVGMGRKLALTVVAASAAGVIAALLVGLPV